MKLGWTKGAALALSVALALNWTPALADDETNDDKDPFEGVNRVTSEFNRGLRTMVINPVAEFYKVFVPPPAREVISNTASNLTEPLSAVSSVLQGDNENAEKAMERFMINTTLGLGGTSDRATEMGVTARQEDLGQAAGANGADSGAHIVLPIFGPSNMRDATGTVVNALLNPLALASTVDDAITYADNKDKLEALSKTAIDPYIAERDAYEQRRKYVIHNGMLIPEMDDFDEPEPYEAEVKK
ncbi:MAG: VacJ family lipoprotein [Alphaproteobacteria bacterium]|nr:VacJ family lipoprotein [Rhodospirillales bacterium]MCW9045367.1 VacJ family lipoprotein [Alphaproteobacteria bacterium]